ncbi:hypothetical protein MITS9509_00451 [Synechococcus sp. MIT S9509]|uniref:hypothetical protein n=1 Tax=Synechococcus sp. MIT S9509 TaxID=1801630 RepID=UPI0007BBE323|nr:hypothetical protein [Synechococcus sp. MIT S9509]KZR93158.1 hypothetical protein MITS9509_00451 [Synechococcus sp. MIT S9509]
MASHKTVLLIGQGHRNLSLKATDLYLQICVLIIPLQFRNQQQAKLHQQTSTNSMKTWTCAKRVELRSRTENRDGPEPARKMSQDTFFQITTAFNPQQQSPVGEDQEMKNEIRVISAFLIVNSLIISSVVLLYMKGGMKFEKVLGYLLN